MPENATAAAAARTTAPTSIVWAGDASQLAAGAATNAPIIATLSLDNLEQLLPAAPVLARLLAAAPGLTLLATSRAALRISAERELPVPPLDRDTATAFFVERARAVKPDFRLTDANADTVTEICARLEGLPLAIELAAARTRLLSPASMLERLGSRLDLLVGGPRDALERQRALRAAIDWSHALLEPDEQLLFARLGVFVGGFTLDAAEPICGDGLPLLDTLDALVAHSLLRERDDRFAMLETIREYAVERLEESGEAPELRRRHAFHYCDLAERAEPALTGPDQAAWLRTLEAEHGNLSAAIGNALQAGDAETALRIGAAARRFWLAHGHATEGRRLLAGALAAAVDLPPELMARASNVAGLLAGEQGDIAAAQRHFDDALAAAERFDSPGLTARIRSNQGVLAYFAGDIDRAQQHFEEGLSLYRTLDDTRGLSVVLQTSAWLRSSATTRAWPPSSCGRAPSSTGRPATTRTTPSRCACSRVLSSARTSSTVRSRRCARASSWRSGWTTRPAPRKRSRRSRSSPRAATTPSPPRA
jgi:predicted ATPase